MADINTNLTDLTNNADRIAVATSTIASAITAKGGTVGANDGLEDFAADIASIPSGGGGSATRKDVNFYDYDGTIVNSYTATEFANLSAMPDNPSHEGLTAQGWNWTLSDAKTYIATNGKLNIGQMYNTSDGKTRLYVNFLDEYKSPTLHLYLEANSEVDVDWGDGSPHSTLTSTSADIQTETHSYLSSGDYIIVLTVISGGIEIRGDNNGFVLLNGTTSTPKNYVNCLFKIEVGNNVSNIGNYAFRECYSLKTITLSNSIRTIADRGFQACKVTSITIPSSVTSIGNNAFSDCSSLTSITIPSSVTSIGKYAFSSCSSLTSITIPNSVTSINGSAFYSCSSLTSITIPNSVISINGNTFNNCYSLLYINYLGADLPTGSPWGAPNTHIKVRALRLNNYTSTVNEASSGTTLTTSVSCTVGDLIVATFENLGGEYTLPSGWTLLGDSGAVVISQWTQRTGMAYKIAEATTESFTLTQASSGRMFTNLIAITGASIGTFSGFTKNETNNTITATKPQGLTIWAVSTMWWGSKWEVTPIDDKAKISNLRCENFLDQSDDTTVTFTTDTTQAAGGLACASLTITGIDNFWYYDD